MNPREVASILLGTWQVRATSIPLWLSNARTAPAVAFGLVSKIPLRLRADVSWNSADGRREHQRGIDLWTGSGFRRRGRGRGRRRLNRCRWSVVGASADGDILVLRLAGSRSTGSGFDVIVRSGADTGDVRSLVAHSATALGLTAEDFASLTWLDQR